MRVRKEVIAEVVAEASAKMSDPNYSAVMVGGFVQSQNPTAQYISAHADEMGGAEQVVNAIFHAALIALGYQRANNRSVPQMSYEDLDHVAGDDVAERLESLQPSVCEYINSNVERAEMRTVLYLVALAMDWVS
ncbi:MAG: hypothetical protein MJE77_29330 [Proteobacteria bacterium]|nr:hypothetical protein [Pseudomonadota bacterium]